MITGNRSSVTSQYAAEAQYFEQLLEAHLVQTLASLLEQDNLSVIVDAL